MLLNYSSLKKFIPGTSAYKAKKAAQEEEIQRLFKLPFSFLSNRKATFAKWRNAGKTPKQVKKGLRAGDTVTHDGAKRFANQYAEYLKTLK
ncbi:Beta-lactamase [Phytophthora megakarya]|uniref:Beta-lactamase n=1 Tax=Phytophthora megakarya TaxID=4795 RepID=A0A225VAA9_9STRA|nr:Beta-lactamase [Phytophthora megakarya]